MLLPVIAYGSFGGTPCRENFGCHFLGWGILVGVVGVPISAAIFAVLHLVFCNGARSRGGQFLLGGFFGVVAYEIAAVCASFMAAWGMSAPGHNERYPLIGFAAGYLVLAIAAVVYVRSSPRHPVQTPGVDE